MKLITPNLLKFSAFSLLLTALFKWRLNEAIENKIVVAIVLSSVVYALLLLASALYFARKDKEYLPIFDIGFRFHLAIYTTYHLIASIWTYLDLEAPNTSTSIPKYVALGWLILICIHFIFLQILKKRSISNLNKKDIFE